MKLCSSSSRDWQPEWSSQLRCTDLIGVSGTKCADHVSWQSSHTRHNAQWCSCITPCTTCGPLAQNTSVHRVHSFTQNANTRHVLLLLTACKVAWQQHTATSAFSNGCTYMAHLQIEHRALQQWHCCKQFSNPSLHKALGCSLPIIQSSQAPGC